MWRGLPPASGDNNGFYAVLGLAGYAMLCSHLHAGSGGVFNQHSVQHSNTNRTYSLVNDTTGAFFFFILGSWKQKLQTQL